MGDDPRLWKRRENNAKARSVDALLEWCECGEVAHDTDSWRAYLTDDEPPEIAVYCPDCAAREFG